MWFLNSGAGVAVFWVGCVVLCFSNLQKNQNNVLIGVAGKSSISKRVALVFMSNVAALLHCCSLSWRAGVRGVRGIKHSLKTVEPLVAFISYYTSFK